MQTINSSGWLSSSARAQRKTTHVECGGNFDKLALTNACRNFQSPDIVKDGSPHFRCIIAGRSEKKLRQKKKLLARRSVLNSWHKPLKTINSQENVLTIASPLLHLISEGIHLFSRAHVHGAAVFEEHNLSAFKLFTAGRLSFESKSRGWTRIEKTKQTLEADGQNKQTIEIYMSNYRHFQLCWQLAF